MLDESSRNILKQYKSRVELYKKIQEIVSEQLRKLISDLGMAVCSVESRVKTEKSLTGKLELKGYKYKDITDITDIVGARIVTFYSDEVDKIASCVESLFEIDWEHSVDKRKILDIDQFGYLSMHFICTIPKSMYYDEQNEILNSLPFEVQVRTVLQHAWATVQHDLGYKTDVEIPREYLRTMNRLAGILEVADDEFKRVRTSVDDYRKKVKSIVKSGNFNDMELNGDSFSEFINFGAFEKLNKRISEINSMDVIPVPLDRFLQIFKGLKCNTLGDVEKIIKEYSEKAYQLALLQFGGKDIDIIASSVGVTCLCNVYILAQGYGESGLMFFYKALNGDKKSNDNLVQRTMEWGKKIGIIS